MPVRRLLKDVPSLVEEIGAHAAADLGPALSKVADQH
jgi:hypothetical protein